MEAQRPAPTAGGSGLDAGTADGDERGCHREAAEEEAMVLDPGVASRSLVGAWPAAVLSFLITLTASKSLSGRLTLNDQNKSKKVKKTQRLRWGSNPESLVP
jgi:hypothetical protein